jgi:hypothetical protein
MTLAAVPRPGSSPARARARPPLGCWRHSRRAAAAESPRSAPLHGPDSAERSSADRGRRRGGRNGHTRSDANARHTRAMMWARLPRIPDSAPPCLCHRPTPSRCSSRGGGTPEVPPRQRVRRAAPRAASCFRGPSMGAPHDRCRYGVPPPPQPAPITQVAALRRTFRSGKQRGPCSDWFSPSPWAAAADRPTRCSPGGRRAGRRIPSGPRGPGPGRCSLADPRTGGRSSRCVSHVRAVLSLAH